MAVSESTSLDSAIPAVAALTRRILLPLIVFGALLVLLGSFAFGELLEHRLLAGLESRAADALERLRADERSSGAGFDSSDRLLSVGRGLTVALLDPRGDRVLAASSAALRDSAAGTLARLPMVDGFDGRYLTRHGVLAGDGSARYWLRLDAAPDLRRLVAWQLGFTAGALGLMIGALALCRRQLYLHLLPGLAALDSTLAGQVTQAAAIDDPLAPLIAASARLQATAASQAQLLDAERREAARGEQWLAQLLECQPVATLICDDGGRPLRVNAAAIALLGTADRPRHMPRLVDLLPEWSLPAPDAANVSAETVMLRQGQREPVIVHCCPAPSRERREYVLMLEDEAARRQAEGEMRASDERYRRLVEATHDGVWGLDRALRTVNANDRLHALLRIAPPALAGRPAPSLVADDEEALAEALRATLDGAAFEPREVAFRCGDGTKASVLLAATAVPGDGAEALVLTLADITSLKNAEEALRENRQRFTAAAANGDIALWDYDCDSGALEFDSRYAALSGLDNATPVQHVKALLELCHPADASMIVQRLDDHIAGRTPSYEAEFRMLTAGSGYRWYRARGQLVARDARGGGRRMTGMQQDITAEREATEALATARDEAVQAARVKSQFLANMSHELRTPLNGVLGMLSLLEREMLSDEQREFVEVAMKSGRSLFDLINNVLDFSKIEARGIVLEHIECDLHTLAEDVVDMLAESAHQRGLDIVMRYTHELSRRVHTDPARLRQVLLNLLGNAVKFTDRGQITLTVRPGVASGRIRFEVSDTGIGIPESQQGRIFEPFKQADSATTRRFGGTGLGLSITRQLVELMGGTLALSSTPGVGSRFSFELPLEALPMAVTADESPALAGCRILLQEANPAVAEAGAELLRAHGASVACVRDLREILPALDTDEQAFDVAMFAVGNDLTASARELAAIHAAPGLRNLKLLATVPFGRRTEAGDVRALGVHGLVTRPMRESHVLRALSDLLSTTPPLAAPVNGVASAEAPRALADLRVLVVDDVITNLKVAAGMLGKLGIKATLADSGRAALDALTGTEFQVVCMDCQMPGMDGFETTALIRARYLPGEGPRIIAMTANAASTDRDKCLANGMDDYLAKPVLLSDLERVLHRWVNAPASPAHVRPLHIGVATALEPVDRRKLDELSALLGPAEYEALCERFRRDGRLQLERLSRNLDAGDLAAARQAVHALKGAAGNLGAVLLSSLCRQCEGAGPTDMKNALPDIVAAFDGFCATLMHHAALAAA